jgi:hypothetical protein
MSSPVFPSGRTGRFRFSSFAITLICAGLLVIVDLPTLCP